MSETTVRVISSMATRLLLAEGAAAFGQAHGVQVTLEAVGGVDAARRVQAGEAFDAVVLASGAIDELLRSGRATAGSRTDLARSGVSVAVRAGAARPDIGTEEALKAAVLAAPTIGYSTGPSGTHLLRTFERWGVAQTLQARTVQAPPGVPVGTMVADGRVALGFQQLSELMNLPGIDVVGPLPGEVQILTVFSGAVCAAAAQPGAARAWLDFMACEAMAGAKRRHGMEPA
jgi:molybdate transport system substrate-binding protein